MSTVSACHQEHIDNVRSKMSTLEFIFLTALLMASNALAMDIMLPAFPAITDYFALDNRNHIQYVISSYLLGYAICQVILGPISDKYGRRTPLLLGLSLYVICALLCVFSTNFWMLLCLRFLQGIGASATCLTLAVVRDVYSGSKMARIMSFTNIVFMIVPILAPALGMSLLWVFQDWRVIFLFMAFAGLTLIIWTYIRLPETLYQKQDKITFNSTKEAFMTVFSNRTAMGYTIAVSCVMGGLYASLMSCKQIYDDIYNLGVFFPVVFASVAIFLACASYNNSILLKKYSMRFISHWQLTFMIIFSAIWSVLALSMDVIPFPIFMLFYAAVMFSFGGIGANFRSISMEPLGKVAGTAASVTGFSITLIGTLLGLIVGQLFNYTTLPLAGGFLTYSLLAMLIIFWTEKGKLFNRDPD